jgi:hypothetical protein
MLMKRQITALFAAFLCVAFLFACADEKGPATTAVKAAEEAMKAINKDEAMKYAAEKFSAVEKELTAAKDSLAKNDFKGALAAAKEIPAKASEIVKAITEGKKAALAKAWESTSAGLPKVFDQIQSRIDVLSKSKAKKAAADTAKTGLEEVKKMWAGAQDLFKAGKATEAMDALKSVKGKTADLLTSLGMPVPDALK